jgi:hypothetical protein
MGLCIHTYSYIYIHATLNVELTGIDFNDLRCDVRNSNNFFFINSNNRNICIFIYMYIYIYKYIHIYTDVHICIYT